MHYRKANFASEYDFVIAENGMSAHYNFHAIASVAVSPRSTECSVRKHNETLIGTLKLRKSCSVD